MKSTKSQSKFDPKAWQLHLEIVCDKQRQHGIEVYTGAAYVAYRETLVPLAGTVTRNWLMIA